MKKVLNEEAQAILSVSDTLDEQITAINAACDVIMEHGGGPDNNGKTTINSGRLVCIGVGKAGLIARKASATFSSTGTPGFFLHPPRPCMGIWEPSPPMMWP